MRYIGARGKTEVIVEDAAGEDQDRQWKQGSRWSAAIIWSKT
jgi:hypothetical protein